MISLQNGGIMQKVMENTILRMISIGVIAALGFVFAGAGPAFARSDSVAGEWNAALTTPGGVSNFKIIFKVDGEKLTGTVKRASGDVPLEGTIKGNDLQFSYVIVYNGNNLTMSMTGKLEGDTINGLVFFGESGQSSEWTAKRVVEP